MRGPKTRAQQQKDLGEAAGEPAQLTRQGSKYLQRSASRKLKKHKSWDQARQRIESELSITVRRPVMTSRRSSETLFGWDTVIKRAGDSSLSFGRAVKTAIVRGMREARWVASNVMSASSKTVHLTPRASYLRRTSGRTASKYEENAEATTQHTRWGFSSRSSRRSRASASKRESFQRASSSKRESTQRASASHARVPAPEVEVEAAEEEVPPRPLSEHPQQSSNMIGWRGSFREEHIEGVHEHRDAWKARRRLRLLPEVQVLVETLWAVAAPKGETPRMALKSYMDYHLSCYHFITSIDEDSAADDEGVDLFDAWETAVRDWRADTAEMIRTYHAPTLHFDSFRDSVFQLIDLYTDTLDTRQYVGYMRRLVEEITVVVDERTGKRAWAQAWDKSAKGPLELAMKAALRGSFEAREGCVEDLRAKHAAWISAQEAARGTEDAAAKAEGDAEASSEAQAAELMPRGFAAAYESLRKDPTVAALFPPGVPDQKSLIHLFCAFDADYSGGISIDDLISIVLDGATSGWLIEPIKGLKPPLAARSASASAAKPEKSTGKSTGKSAGKATRKKK